MFNPGQEGGSGLPCSPPRGRQLPGPGKRRPVAALEIQTPAAPETDTGPGPLDALGRPVGGLSRGQWVAVVVWIAAGL